MENKKRYWIYIVMGVLMITGVILAYTTDYQIFSAGEFASGYFSAGEFSIGVFSAGIFSIGVFSAGIFSIGIFSIGIFNVGLFIIGLFLLGWKKRKLSFETKSETEEK